MNKLDDEIFINFLRNIYNKAPNPVERANRFLKLAHLSNLAVSYENKVKYIRQFTKKGFIDYE